jgi:hypothetical protein
VGDEVFAGQGWCGGVVVGAHRRLHDCAFICVNSLPILVAVGSFAFASTLGGDF